MTADPQFTRTRPAVSEADNTAAWRTAPQAATVEEHVRALRAQGQWARVAGPRTFWQAAEMRSLALHPEFLLEVPEPAAIRRMLWRVCSPLATYVRPPDASHPQNAWLYVSADQHYHLDKLKRTVRRNIRRAQEVLRFEFLDDETLRQHGAKAFCDTRTRVGLSDGTVAAFCRMHAAHVANPGRAVVGAWAGDQLAGYVTLSLVDDWAEIYIYAQDAFLSERPVNGLIDHVFDYFLVQRRFRLVSLGVSSIQEESNAAGLHAFKRYVGCECRPVHRAFVFHPILAPFANSLTLWGLRCLRGFWPRHPEIRKAAGILAAHRGANPMPQDTRDSSEE